MDKETLVKIVAALLNKISVVEGIPGVGKLIEFVWVKAKRRARVKEMLSKPPDTLAPGAPPSRLLRPEYEIIPFTGRENELQELTNWAIGDEEKVAVSLITGGPGCGKSRIAQQLCLEVKKRDPNSWFCGLLEAGKGDQPEDFKSLVRLPGPLLLVIDYAERKNKQIEALVQAATDARKARQSTLFKSIASFLDRHESEHHKSRQSTPFKRIASFLVRYKPKHHKVRLVLLARSPDEWWDSLRSTFNNRSSPFDKPYMLALQPITQATNSRDGVDVSAIYQESYQAFCRHLQRDSAEPETPEFPDQAEFLDIHLAALLAASGEQIKNCDEQELFEALLGRELTAIKSAPQWHDVIGQGLKQNQPMTEILAWFGALDDPGDKGEATKRLALLPSFSDQAQAIRQAAAAALRALYPPVSGESNRGWWGGIAPDRFATFLTGKLDPSFLKQAAKELSGPALTSLLRHLSWYEQRYPEDSQKTHARMAATLKAGGLNALRATIILAPQINGEALAKEAEELIKQEELLKDWGDAVLLANDLPEKTVVLASLVRSIGEIKVKYYRALAEKDPDTYNPALAGSLNDFGNRLSDIRKHEEALAATQEAVGLYRGLAEKSPDAYNPNLAMSLNNLGNRLSDIRKYEEALAATQEAVNLRRALTKKSPDAYNPDLAGSLNNLGNRLSTIEKHKEALEVTQEAVELYRALAEKSPDAYNLDLAGSLNNLSNRLSATEKHEEALAVAQEAVEFYRDLAEKSPDAYNPALAISLTNLGNRLSVIGKDEEALAAAQEAAELYRALAERSPDAYNLDLAGSLTNLGNRLSATEKHEEALTAAQKAVELCRALAKKNPAVYNPALAMGLTNLGNRLSVIGKDEEALEVTQEAVELYRTLAERSPDAYNTALAGNLNNLGYHLIRLDRHDEALKILQEAENLWRSLHSRHADIFKDNLVIFLKRLAHIYDAKNQPDEATKARDEANRLSNPGHHQQDQ